MAIDINLSECFAKIIPKKHYEYPERLQYLSGTLTHPVLGELATMRCLQIQRRPWFKQTGDFLQLMDEESQELHEFSVGLFDRHSNVRPWLVDGGAKSGSGCWGTELSAGDIFYVQDVAVKEDFRRRGVGSWLLQKLLASPHIGYGVHVFCWPTPNGFTADDKAGRMKEQDVITAFYRKNGFRRVGLSQFLAYSPDPSHPSRRLPTASDPETPSRDFDSSNTNAPDLSSDELQSKYPLHYAIATNKTPAVAQVIRAAHQDDWGSVHKRDLNGFSPVHIAAASENINALRALLKLDPSGMTDDLKDEKNADGMTALDALKSSMRSTREFMETHLRSWNGYENEGLSCEYLVTKAIGTPLMPTDETEEEFIKKRKFGCTCGMCTDGWLSPRMRFRLSNQAAVQEDMHLMDLSLFKPRHPLSASDLFYCAFEYVPLTLQREIYKTFHIGFYTIFRAIYQILETSRIPTPQAVLAEAQALDARAVHFYMAKGGKVEYVLDATVDMAREQSSLGDGTFEDTFDCDESELGEGDSEESGYSKLVRCSNDLEFGIVRRNVGLGVGVRWGPYVDMEEEERMEVDKDADTDDGDSDREIC